MKLRETNVHKLGEETFDVCVVGGGINGAVSAASLAGRGLRVALVDRGDFAGATSQQSSNLAWGGIKYLEGYEFGLVRKLCVARNRLIRAYPSTVRPIRFFVTHAKTFRKARVLVWLGAWLYWLLGAGFLGRPRLLSVKDLEAEEPIVDTKGADGGIEYWDAHLHDNDARFVWNFVRAALNRGAVAANYVEILGGAREGQAFRLDARDAVGGGTFTIRARVVVNAAGPFADALNERLGVTTRHMHVLSKGVHLLVRRLTRSWRVLTFFADDGRLFFMIPMGPCTCIGTTDTKVDAVPARSTEEDRRFILDNLNERLKLPAPLTEADVVAERCGARPLVVLRPPAGGDGGKKGGDRDWMQLSRKHVIEEAGRVLTIFGGKLTDCLNVGDEIHDEVTRLGAVAPHPTAAWYGEPPDAVKDEFLEQARAMRLDAMTSPEAAEPLTTRLWRRYGAEAIVLLESIRRDPKNGELLIENAEYLRCEIDEAARREMIVRLSDFLRRRSKIALVVSRERLRASAGLREACAILFGDEADRRLEEYFDETAPAPAST